MATLGGNRTSSFICLAELYEGVERSRNKDKEENNLVEFFSELHDIFGIDHDVAKKFGELRADLKKSGNIIEDMDLLVAATCIANNLILITHNRKHFARIPDLKIH